MASPVGAGKVPPKRKTEGKQSTNKYLEVMFSFFGIFEDGLVIGK